MEQVLAAGIGMSDGYVWEALLAAFGIAIGLALAFFGLGGNTFLVLLGLGLAFFDSERFFDARLVASLILVYALGEVWEFAVSFFGIKTERIPWWGVFLIGCGTLTGGLLGTMFLPVSAACSAGRRERFSWPMPTNTTARGTRRTAAPWPGKRPRCSVSPCSGNGSRRWSWPSWSRR